eukprot:gene4586-4800_t
MSDLVNLVMGSSTEGIPHVALEPSTSPGCAVTCAVENGGLCDPQMFVPFNEIPRGCLFGAPDPEPGACSLAAANTAGPTLAFECDAGCAVTCVVEYNGACTTSSEPIADGSITTIACNPGIMSGSVSCYDQTPIVVTCHAGCDVTCTTTSGGECSLQSQRIGNLESATITCVAGMMDDGPKQCNNQQPISLNCNAGCDVTCNGKNGGSCSLSNETISDSELPTIGCTSGSFIDLVRCIDGQPIALTCDAGCLVSCTGINGGECSSGTETVPVNNPPSISCDAGLLEGPGVLCANKVAMEIVCNAEPTPLPTPMMTPALTPAATPMVTPMATPAVTPVTTPALSPAVVCGHIA